MIKALKILINLYRKRVKTAILNQSFLGHHSKFYINLTIIYN